MGRKSLAEKYHEQVEEDYEEEMGAWLVLYDFKGIKEQHETRRGLGGWGIPYSV